MAMRASHRHFDRVPILHVHAPHFIRKIDDFVFVETPCRRCDRGQKTDLHTGSATGGGGGGGGGGASGGNSGLVAEKSAFTGNPSSSIRWANSSTADLIESDLSSGMVE